jgi:hypothetical protein
MASCEAAFRPLLLLEEGMNINVRKIESNRKVSKIFFMVYWRHYG